MKLHLLFFLSFLLSFVCYSGERKIADYYSSDIAKALEDKLPQGWKCYCDTSFIVISHENPVHMLPLSGLPETPSEKLAKKMGLEKDCLIVLRFVRKYSDEEYNEILKIRNQALLKSDSGKYHIDDKYPIPIYYNNFYSIYLDVPYADFCKIYPEEVEAQSKIIVLEFDKLLKKYDNTNAAASDSEVDTPGLKEAVEKIKNIHPVVSKPGMMHNTGRGISVLGFSHDGKCFATAGLDTKACIWNTSDWSLRTSIERLDDIDILLFSPDDKYLYVAGRQIIKPNGVIGFICRYDTATGLLNKEYIGHKGGVNLLFLSPDGSKILSGSREDKNIMFWDAESPKPLQTYNYVDGIDAMGISPDGKRVFVDCAIDLIEIDLATGKVDNDPKTDDGLNYRRDWTYSENKKYLATHYYEKLSVYEINKDKFKNLEDLKIEYDQSHRPCNVAAISESAKRLAIGGEGVIWYYSLPDFNLLKKYSYNDNMRQYSIHNLTFSPDGKWLLAAARFGAPMIFKAENMEELLPYEGHGTRIENIYFPEDKNIIKTVSYDGQICIWDKKTMKMNNRISPPQWFSILGIQPESGRYAVCYEPDKIKRLLQDEPKDKITSFVKIMDTDNGKVICSFSSPFVSYGIRLFWLNDHMAILAADKELCQFDYLSGKILKRVKIDDVHLLNRFATPSEDGKSIIIPADQGKGNVWIKYKTIDIDTGKATEKRPEQHVSYPGNQVGIVPGGKYFYITGETVHIFDRESLSQVSRIKLLKSELSDISFTSDGAKFLIVNNKSKTSKELRIYDTTSSKILYCFPESSTLDKAKISPDGKAVVVANKDGTIEYWDLP